tara:strand:- start:60 stop:1502 length:1443 start_codon:yes stop_codon:yes gene_type:complete
MINTKSEKNQKFSSSKLAEILFYTFPLSFIIGNLAVTINILLFIFSSLYVIKKKRLNFRFNNSYWLLIAFFLYFAISTTVQYPSLELINQKVNQHFSLEYDPIIKSLLLFRFLILIFVIDALIFNKILDLKKFFLSSLICTSFVGFDIIIQYLTGTDLFGYKTLHDQSLWNSGPFGDEKIAGGYLKNFSFFAFIYVFVTCKNKNLKNFLSIFILTFLLTAALLAGNRMPMLLFLFGCVLMFLFIKNLRFVISLSLICFFSLFLIIIKLDSNYKDSYTRFFGDLNFMELIDKNKKNNQENSEEKSFEIIDGKYSSVDVPKDLIFLKYSGYNQIYRTSIMLWKERPLTGSGLKSLRIKCWYLLEEDTRKFGVRPQNIACGNHSHHYYLQLLSEAGLIGTILLVIFFFILVKDSFYYIKKYNQKENLYSILIIPIIISIFLEIWPLRSSGSFFTNWNATFFWLNIGIFFSINKNNFFFKLYKK